MASRKLSPPPPQYEGALPVLAPPSLTSSAADVKPHAKPARWALRILTSPARMHPKSEPEKHAHPGPGHRPEARNHCPCLPQQETKPRAERGARGRGLQGDRKPAVISTHLRGQRAHVRGHSPAVVRVGSSRGTATAAAAPRAGSVARASVWPMQPGWR